MIPSGGGAPGLRPELAMRLGAVARAAAATGVEAYLVGGTVRDLLLGRDSPDLDFVAVGDGLLLGGAVQRELGGRLVRHPTFLTADVVDAQGFHLDIATARQETYSSMAVLPEVRPAELEADLLRRDFTVNAMALPLAAGEPGWVSTLVDPAGGRDDLRSGLLRVMHEKSFLDDPTRVLRGVRFEARLGFRFAASTEALAREAVAAGAFARLSGSRLRRELELMLGAAPLPAMALLGLERLADLGVLATVHPCLRFDGAAHRRVQAAALELAWHGSAGSPPPAVRAWLLLLMALLSGLDGAERRTAARRLALAGEELRLAAGSGGFDGSLAAIPPRLAAGAKPSQVDAELAALGGEDLLLLAAEGGAVTRAWVRRYWLEMRPLTVAVGGADLLAAGAASGPEIGDALRATRAARLDAEIEPGEELEFALARLRGAGGRLTPVHRRAAGAGGQEGER